MSERHSFSQELFDQISYNKDGSVSDGTRCPWCWQPRPSEFFYDSALGQTTSKCRNCRKKVGRWA